MEMTFNDYINNPMGKKNSVFASRELYREMYRKKLDAILLREVGKVKYKLYKTKDKNMYIIHFKIPSEPLKNFYYDTVIQFYSKDHGVQISNNLKKYYVKFYSNDPSFVFTFAHSFKQNNLFIKDLESKMSKEALKTKAIERNPKDEVGYVKSIFFAYLLMEQYGLFDKTMFDIYGETYNKNRFLETVTHADVKVNDRIEKQSEANKKKKIEREKEKYEQNKIRKEANPININPISTVNRANRTKRTNRVSSVKKTKKSRK